MQLIVQKNNNEVMWLRQANALDNSTENLQLILNYICQYAGGQPDDYKVVNVPQEQEAATMRARYITYDGENFNIDDRLPIVTSVMQITVTAGWVKANKRLLDDVIINIPIDDDNDRTLQIEIIEDNTTEEIEVLRYLWFDYQEKSELPAGKTLLWTIGKMEIPMGTTDLGELLWQI